MSHNMMTRGKLRMVEVNLDADPQTGGAVGVGMLSAAWYAEWEPDHVQGDGACQCIKCTNGRLMRSRPVGRDRITGR